MADTTRGLKAGFGAGIISGAVGGIIGMVAVLTILYPKYKSLFGMLSDMPPNGTISIDVLIMFIMTMIPLVLVVGAIIGAIIGAVIGLIYAFLYNKLPGKTAIAKGLFTGVICFILVFIFSLLGQITSSGEAVTADIEQNLLMISVGHAINFVVVVIFGYFLGRFWKDLEPED